MGKPREERGESRREALHLPASEGQTSKGVRLLQPLGILEWKLEHVSTDFMCGLPRITIGHDAIWMTINRLMKSAHFF